MGEIAEDGVVEDASVAPEFVERTGQVLPGFAERTFALRELLDEPCTFAEYAAAMRDMARVSRLTRGYVPAMKLLAKTVADVGVGHEPLRVVDLGCGHGDMLRQLHRWARRRSVPLRLTGVDAQAYAGKLARQCDRVEHVSAGTIAWQRADFLSVELPVADVVLCNLVAHHLCDADVVRLLRICATARVGFLITDLRRSERAARMFGAMGWALRLHSMVKHDGDVSFRRAFSLGEWEALVAEAGVVATVRDIGWGRVAISG